MNIKKSQEILKRWLGCRPSDQYVSYQALDSIIAALDEKIEPRKSPFDGYHYCQGWDAAIKEHCIPKEKEIKKLNADLAIANGLVKNLEEQKKSLEDKYYSALMQISAINNVPFKKDCAGFVPREEYEELRNHDLDNLKTMEQLRDRNKEVNEHNIKLTKQVEALQNAKFWLEKTYECPHCHSYYQAPQQ